MASRSSVVESTVPQAEDEWVRQSCGFYACPVCRQGLEPVRDGLSCRVCARTYPILSGIPDFTVVNFEGSNNFSMRVAAKRVRTEVDQVRAGRNWRGNPARSVAAETIGGKS
jgi:hypothetical protein